MKKHLIIPGLLVWPAFAFIATDLEKAHKATRIACETRLVGAATWKDPQSCRILELKTRNSGTLTYFGAEPSGKPSQAQITGIREAWEKSKPTLVFYEGPNQGFAATRTETIKQFGEAGLIRSLAARDHVKTRSLEPNLKEEMDHLGQTQKFSPEQVKLFYVLRETVRLRDQQGQTGQALKTSIGQFLKNANALFPELKTAIPDTTALQTAYAKYWNSPQTWTNVPAAWFDQNSVGNKNGSRFLAEINRISSEFREIYMYNTLSEAVQRGEKVFAIASQNHVARQAEALKCSLKGL